MRKSHPPRSSAIVFPASPSRYDAALSRHADWLSANQDADGLFRGEGISCGAYMPLPLYGHATGRHEVARRAWQILQASYIRDGRLIQPEARRDMMPYTPAWLVMGAALEENLLLRSVLKRHLLTYQDGTGGGFFGSTASSAAGRGVIDFDSTTQACAALCIAGDEAAAVKCGRYLRKLVEAQPDPSRRFFLQWHTERGLIREFDPKEATTYVLDYSGRKQHLYKIGLLARALALLNGMTGEAAYLELAESLYRKAAADSPDIWSNTLAHKMALAAWTLWGLTGQQTYAKDIGRMADHLVSLQQADGGFHYPELWSSYDAAPLDPKLNIGSQFATWIVYARAVTSEV